MRSLLALLPCVVAIALSSSASALTYTVDLTLNGVVLDDVGQSYDIGTASGNGTVFDPSNPVYPPVFLTGTITTDGTLGALNNANILDYAITYDVDILTGVIEPLPSHLASFPQSFNSLNATGLSATPTELAVTGAFSFGYGASVSSTSVFSVIRTAFRGDTDALEVDAFSAFGGVGAGPGFSQSGFTATEDRTDAPFAIATVAPVPLPAGAVLLLSGLFAAGVAGKRRAAPHV